jgi:hypothetical protein
VTLAVDTRTRANQPDAPIVPCPACLFAGSVIR